jgi:hypothetical protein
MAAVKITQTYLMMNGPPGWQYGWPGLLQRIFVVFIYPKSGVNKI